MIKFQNSTLKELQNNSFNHNLDSPIWLFKVEKIFHKGSFYLKVYIIKNAKFDTLNSIKVKVSFNDSSFEDNVIAFKKADSYPNDPILGCLVKLPSDFNDVAYTIELIAVIIDNKLIDLDLSKTIELDYKLDERNSEICKYLGNNIENFYQFPTIFSNYWQCSCGKYNTEHLTTCQNCGRSLESIEKFISVGLNNLFIQTYLEKNPFKPNLNLSYEANLNQYFAPLKNMGFTKEDAHIFGIEKSDLEPRIIQNQLKKKKNRNRILIVSVAALLVIGIILAFNWKTIRVNIAKNHFENGEFEEAKKIYMELNEPEFSKYIADCEMEIAIQLYKNGEYEKAYELAEANAAKASDSKYRNDLKEIKYEYAVTIYDSAQGNNMLFELWNYKRANYYALLYLIEDYLLQYTRYQKGEDPNTIEYAMWSTKFSGPDLLYNEINNYPEFSRYILKWQFFRYSLEGYWTDYNGHYYKQDSDGITQYYLPFNVKGGSQYKYYYYYNDGYYYGNDTPDLKVLNLQLISYNSLQICNLNYDCVTLSRK